MYNVVHPSPIDVLVLWEANAFPGSVLPYCVGMLVQIPDTPEAFAKSNWSYTAYLRVFKGVHKSIVLRLYIVLMGINFPKFGSKGLQRNCYAEHRDEGTQI